MRIEYFSKASRYFLVALLLALPAGVALAGPSHGTATLSGKPGKSADVTRTVNVILRDNMFNRHEIDIRPGETIRFILRNEGELLHEFNIGSPLNHMKHQREMMWMMEMGMLTPTGINPANMNMNHGGVSKTNMKHDDPNSVLVKPGETKKLIWKFGKISDLEYACNLPGHYQAGMVGRFQSRG